MISPEILAVTCGLSSAIVWGAGDFSGGFATKKENVLAVIFFSQIIGGLLLLGLHFFWTKQPFQTDYLIWGGLAGIGGALGLVALYTGLASGRMGVVAPISAVATAAFPLVFAFVIEGMPKITQLLGFGLGLMAVWLLSAPEGGTKTHKNELFLSISAGLGFGCFFICIDHISDQAIILPLLAARVVSVTLMAVILIGKKQMTMPYKGHWPYIALAGVLDTTGNALFALAAQVGRLDVAVVLASMYPASTVMLAWFILKEHLRYKQWIGVLGAMGALVLIAV